MANAEREAALDRTYFRHPLPHPNKVLATWYYPTASEDHQRKLLAAMGAAMPIGRMIFYLDKFKYSMRFALDRIRLVSPAALLSSPMSESRSCKPPATTTSSEQAGNPHG